MVLIDGCTNPIPAPLDDEGGARGGGQVFMRLVAPQGALVATWALTVARGMLRVGPCVPPPGHEHRGRSDMDTDTLEEIAELRAEARVRIGVFGSDEEWGYMTRAVRGNPLLSARTSLSRAAAPGIIGGERGGHPRVSAHFDIRGASSRVHVLGGGDGACDSP